MDTSGRHDSLVNGIPQRAETANLVGNLKRDWEETKDGIAFDFLQKRSQFHFGTQFTRAHQNGDLKKRKGANSDRLLAPDGLFKILRLGSRKSLEVG